METFDCFLLDCRLNANGFALARGPSTAIAAMCAALNKKHCTMPPAKVRNNGHWRPDFQYTAVVSDDGNRSEHTAQRDVWQAQLDGAAEPTREAQIIALRLASPLRAVCGNTASDIGLPIFDADRQLSLF
jgi:hypothetical protein